jgi:hypothetical protein
VETRRRTLEELGEIFKARNPVKASLSKTKIIMRGDGRGVTEMLDKEELIERREFGSESRRTVGRGGRFEMVGFGKDTAR